MAEEKIDAPFIAHTICCCESSFQSTSALSPSPAVHTAHATKNQIENSHTQRLLRSSSLVFGSRSPSHRFPIFKSLNIVLHANPIYPVDLCSTDDDDDDDVESNIHRPHNGWCWETDISFCRHFVKPVFIGICARMQNPENYAKSLSHRSVTQCESPRMKLHCSKVRLHGNPIR